MNTSLWITASVGILILFLSIVYWYSLPIMAVDAVATSTHPSVIKISTSTIIIPIRVNCVDRINALNKEALTIQDQCVGMDKNIVECEEKSNALYQKMADLLKDCDPVKG